MRPRLFPLIVLSLAAWAARAPGDEGTDPIPALVARLASDAPGERAQAARRLEEICRGANRLTERAQIEAVLNALARNTAEVQEPLVGVLASAGAPAVAPIMDAIVRVDGVDLWAHATEALARMGEAGVPSLCGLLNHNSLDLRLCALEAGLRHLQRSRSWVEELTSRFGGSFQNPSPWLLLAIKKRGARCVPALLMASESAHEAVSFGAYCAIAAFCNSDLAGILAGFESPLPAVRTATLRLLTLRFELLLDAEAARKVSGLIADPDPAVAALAEQACLLFPAGLFASVSASLSQALADPRPPVRASALSVLACHGTGLPEISAALADADPLVAATARIALVECKAALGRDLAPLLDPLRDEGLHPAARVLAARALSRGGTAAAAWLPGLAEVATSPATPGDVRAACATAIGQIACSYGHGVAGRAERFAKLAAKQREAVLAGLHWLVRARDASGCWTVSTGGMPNYVEGRTALVLLAFLAAGQSGTEADPAMAEAARAGLAWLSANQTPEGWLSRDASTPVLQHAIASQALCEEWILGGSLDVRRRAQASLVVLSAARNPGLAWQYLPRSQLNNSHVTELATTAMRSGELGGLAFDPKAYAGCLQWMDKMTDPYTGRAGYNMPGGGPNRLDPEKFDPKLSESMTAASIWCRTLLGEQRRERKTMDLGVKLMSDLPPRWGNGGDGVDYYYWEMGARVMAQQEAGKWRVPWLKALNAALMDSQRKAPHAEAGSWDPIDPWSAEGGRAYSTAMAVMALLAEVRFEPRAFAAGKAPPVAGEALRVLERLCRDADASVRAAAEAARAALKR